MRLQYQANLTLEALRRWFLAQCADSLLVSALWLAALYLLHVPWPWFWAIVAGAMQFIPHFGPLLSLMGPALAMLVSGAPWERWIGLLVAYAAIAALDGFVLQPLLMHRANRVPIWASLLVPVVLGIVLPFWGVLLAPPLLAVYYAHRAAARNEAQNASSGAGEQQFSSQSEGVILPPEKPPGEGPSSRE
jgi:predicted PurR-regulated permease PerM